HEALVGHWYLVIGTSSGYTPTATSSSLAACWLSTAALFLPVAIASHSILTTSSIDRMLSSLPGIGKSTTSGSQSVSINATVAIPSFWASLTAFFSFFGSTITRHSGKRFIVRMPSRLRNILRYSRLRDDCIFFEYVSHLASWPLGPSSSSRRVSRLRIVRKLVSVPPSQRSLTYGIPQRSASRAIASPACRFVPTNSTRLPCDEI